MKNVSLSGSPRENVGKKDAKALRRAERVPCVLYGGENQIHFSVDYVDMSKIVFTGDVYQVDLDLDGKKVPAVIKEIQFHPVTDKVIHVDFVELLEDKSIKIKLPVHVTGLAIGVKNGGRLMIPYRKLTIKGKPSSLPDDIEIDISELRIGGKIKVSEIKLEAAKILEPQDTVVVLIKTARNIIEDEVEDEEGEEGEEGVEGEEGSEGGEKAEESSDK
jgi:large subunit ribosomal protein L25